MTEKLCEAPGCQNPYKSMEYRIMPDTPGFDFVRNEWPDLLCEELNWPDIFGILHHERNEGPVCFEHLRSLTIDIEKEPEKAQMIIEAIYRDVRGG